MKKSPTLALVASLAVCGSASATIINGDGLQDALYAAGARNIDVHNDQQQPDEVWMVTSTGFAGARLLFELAGWANENAFGVYDVTNTSNRLTIFNGPNSANSRGLLANEGNEFCAQLWGGAQTCSLFGSGLFGFFLDTPNGVFYSERERNGDGVDHMVAYEGGDGHGYIAGRPWVENEFILGWEDWFGGGDRDYDDFGVLVGPIVAVSEPATLALFGIALLALVALRRRRIRVRGSARRAAGVFHQP
ncbi:MAG TPA: DUF4114 domain-containing protein [Steroidobacteraceae bacterium]|nr:DUF4114 domain-containing protein [Steroidobacteraceae bacterium]